MTHTQQKHLREARIILVCAFRGFSRGRLTPVVGQNIIATSVCSPRLDDWEVVGVPGRDQEYYTPKDPPPVTYRSTFYSVYNLKKFSGQGTSLLVGWGTSHSANSSVAPQWEEEGQKNLSKQRKKRAEPILSSENGSPR